MPPILPAGYDRPGTGGAAPSTVLRRALKALDAGRSAAVDVRIATG